MCKIKNLHFLQTGRMSGSQDDLDDESVQGKQSLDNFSIFSSE